ncbi:MAG: serine hydrolase domain-containing protein [Bacteroidota bacterium]
MKTITIFYSMLVICLISSCADAKQVTNEIQKEAKEQLYALTSERLAHIDEMIELEKAYGHFNGVLMIRYRDSVVFSNHSEYLPAQEQSRFDIGSVSKQFTAAAILTLVNNGQVNLSDQINLHLGEYASKRWDKVTIHHLLTHTSGIPSIYQTEQGLDVFFPQESPTTLSELILVFKDKKLLFTPGDEFAYSNSGYLLLAAIIANVSQQDFVSYLENEIFQRYQLHQTSFQPDGYSAKPVYGYRSDLLKHAPTYHPSWSAGQGGIYSSASDLLKWTSVIQSDDFLTPELRKAYLTDHTQVGYGYGWQLSKDGKITHDGGTAGFMSQLSFHPTSEMAVVVLTNRSFEDISLYGKSGQHVSQIVEKTWDVLLGKAIDVLPDITKRGFERGTDTFELAGISFVAQSDTSFLLSHQEMLLSRLLSTIPIEGPDLKTTHFVAAARALEKRKYWSFAKFCNGEMKFVCFSGLMSIGMKSMRKKTGDVKSVVPYFLTDTYGLIRLHGELGSLDLIVYFDQENRIQGIYEEAFHNKKDNVPQLAYTIAPNAWYVDGFPLGEESCTVSLENNEIYIEQYGRKYSLE